MGGSPRQYNKARKVSKHVDLRNNIFIYRYQEYMKTATKNIPKTLQELIYELQEKNIPLKKFNIIAEIFWYFRGGLAGKESACDAEDRRDMFDP